MAETPNLTKSDSGHPLEPDEPARRGLPLWAIIVAIVAVVSLGAAAFIYSQNSKPVVCNSSDTTMSVTRPDGSIVRSGDTIDGNAGLTVSGKTEMPAGCTTWLFDVSGDYYYLTVPSADTTGYSFVDKPIGGEGKLTQVYLQVIGANQACADDIARLKVQNGSDAYLYGLPTGCTVLESLTVNAQR